MSAVKKADNWDDCLWCKVCGSDEEDEQTLGFLYRTEKFGVHFFCLLFSADFEQNGRDYQGVLGYKINDIKNGFRLIKDKICWYCGYPNASITCVAEGCNRRFHLTCGVQSGCLMQFIGNYDSYCHNHNTVFKYKDYADQECIICSDEIGFACDAVTADCCNGSFHRRCIGRFALSSGYFFKCPLCNNTEIFRRCMPQMGIFVPDRDASWELVANAYQELYGPQYECEAEACNNSFGRGHTSTNWFTFLSCIECGAAAVHRECCDSTRFICKTCQDYINRKEKEAAEQSVLSTAPNSPALGKVLETSIIETENSFKCPIENAIVMSDFPSPIVATPRRTETGNISNILNSARLRKRTFKTPDSSRISRLRTRLKDGHKENDSSPVSPKEKRMRRSSTATSPSFRLSSYIGGNPVRSLITRF